MKKLKEMKAWKKLTILAVSILIIAGVITGGWFLFVQLPYMSYTDGFEKVITLFDKEQYEKKVDDITLEVHLPHFLGNDGFLAVRCGSFSTVILDDGSYKYSDTPDISLFVWPNVLGKVKYGLSIDKPKDEVSGSSTIQFTVLENGKYEIAHNFDDEKVIECFNENEKTIQRMLKAIEESWSFDGIKDVSDGFNVILNSRH